MALRRLQLFEFEDQDWVPGTLRILLTRSLAHMNASLGVYDTVVPILRRALLRSPTPQIVDLCSGAGGPWEHLHPLVLAEHDGLSIVLTDRYPQPESVARWATTGRVEYAAMPVDAGHVPSQLRGVRTIFSGFHHFSPAVATRVLADAVRQRVPIAVFEFTRRKLFNVALAIVAGGLGMPLVVPWLRPPDLAHVVWTYLLPLGPLAYAWDGAISNLRSYTPQELSKMAEVVARPDYAFEVGELPTPHLPTPLTYLLGLPLDTTP